MTPSLPYAVVAGATRSSAETNANFAAMVTYLNQGQGGTIDAGIQADSFGLNTSPLTFSLTNTKALDITFSSLRDNRQLIGITSSVATSGVLVSFALTGTGVAGVRLNASSGALGLNVTHAGTGAALALTVPAAASAVVRTGTSTTAPLVVTSTGNGAVYGAFATGALPAVSNGALGYDTTLKLPVFRKAGAWQNAALDWFTDSSISASTGSLVAYPSNAQFSVAKWAAKTVHAATGTVSDNSGTSFPGSSTQTCTFTKAIANSTLLVMLSGTHGSRDSGGTTPGEIVVGIYNETTNTLLGSVSDRYDMTSGLDGRGRAGGVVPISGVAAGAVTLGLRIRRGSTGSSAVYWNGTFRVVEM